VALELYQLTQLEVLRLYHRLPWMVLGVDTLACHTKNEPSLVMIVALWAVARSLVDQQQKAIEIVQMAERLQLKKHGHLMQWLFVNPQTHKPYRCIFHKWNRIRSELGLHDMRIHDLRHSFASTLVNNGATLYEVQKLLGHSRSATTERYAHLANHRLQRAASLIDKAYS
jgi:site-specific recombinase XerC